MRREPTIGGIKPDHSEKKEALSASRDSARPALKTAQGRRIPTPAPRPAAPSSSFPVLASIAILLALAASAGAYWLHQELLKTQAALSNADLRLQSLEASLKLTGNESMQSVAAINDSLKTHFSEIDKLWAAYRKHKASIAQNSKLAKTASSAAAKATKQVSPLASELAVVSDLVDAQQSALTRIEQNNASISAQARASNERSAKLEQKLQLVEQKLGNAEKDIEAINGFRRSVNQQILELKGTAQ